MQLISSFLTTKSPCHEHLALPLHKKESGLCRNNSFFFFKISAQNIDFWYSLEIQLINTLLLQAQATRSVFGVELMKILQFFIWKNTVHRTLRDSIILHRHFVQWNTIFHIYTFSHGNLPWAKPVFCLSLLYSECP